jgi:hypothetical protein
MSMSLPKQPSNPLTAFGQSIQQSIISHFAGIDADFVKEDETKDEFFKNVSSSNASKMAYSLENLTASDSVLRKFRCGFSTPLRMIFPKQ